MAKRMIIEEFVEKAREIHGDKYDYSRVRYVNVRTKVKIICKKCGRSFWQAPTNHLSGQGCPICAIERLKLTRGEFIRRAREIHGDKYNYSRVNYINSYTKVRIRCNICGFVFEQTPHDHLQGKGCPRCNSNGRFTTEEFVKRAREVHKDRYNYSEVDYINSRTKVKIKCNKCNNFFWQTPDTHLRGHGCPICALEKNRQVARAVGRKQRLTTEEFIERAKKVHGDRYDYSEVRYSSNKEKVKIKCNICGNYFWQLPFNHLKGYGCPVCGLEKARNARRSDEGEFIKKAVNVHGNKYNYSKVEYINAHTKVEIICKEHGSFWQIPNNHLQGEGCPKCASSNSRGEQELREFIEFLGFKTEKYRDGKYEIDIFIPVLGIGFEYNGYFYHKFPDKPRRYHQDKSLYFAERGIKLIHIWDWQWYKRQDIIKSIIEYNLGKIKNKIYARDCKIVDLISKEAFNFHQQNHLFGGVYSKVNLGLTYNNKIVQVLSFNPHQSYQWEISRFSTKLGVVIIGGFSKLFKRFFERYNPQSILSYSYIDLNNIWKDSIYCKIGFCFAGITSPSYYYLNRNLDVKSRIQCQRYKLIKKYPKYKNLSEFEIMEKLKYFRIYNAGNFKFIWEA